MSRFIQKQRCNIQSPVLHNYRNYTLLSLDKALASVLFVVNGLKDHAELALSVCWCPSTIRLTRDESAAIYLYTTDRGKECLHHVLNRALISGDSSSIRPWFGFLKLFTTALEKLPSVQGIIWRAIHIDIAAELHENEEITWWNISSCSRSISVINYLLDDHSILCSIEALNGKSLSAFAYDVTQDEVLLLPGTRLRMKYKRIDRVSGKCILYVEEIINNNDDKPMSNHNFTSLTNKSFTHDPKLKNATVSYVSTANITIDNDISDEYRSRNNKVFSVTSFLNGDRYEVPYKEGQKQGYGMYFCHDGQIYQDFTADAHAKGMGIRTYSNGDRYEGFVEYGQMHGSGVYIRADGYMYEGDWINDKSVGVGKSSWPNETYHKGSYKNGVIHGYGTFWSTKGNKYKGDLIDGKAHGRGERFWRDGDRYEGYFKDDKKDGRGTYYFSSGARYAGAWIKDQMSGDGIYAWPSGTHYIGAFKNGKRHGKGKLIFANGEVKDGFWENNRYIGYIHS